MEYSAKVSEKYNRIVDIILDGKKVSCKKKEIPGGYEHIIETREAKLTITINKKWIGYELLIAPLVVGKKIGTSLDTDLYPLDYNTKITEEIAQETIECLNGLLDGRIYVGQNKNKYYLAVPTLHGYRLEGKGRFLTKVEDIDADDIKARDFLKPVK